MLVGNGGTLERGDRMTSYVDVAIPGFIGLVMFIWPRSMFLGSRVTPNAHKIRWLRYLGVFLLLVAAFNPVIKFVSK